MPQGIQVLVITLLNLAETKTEGWVKALGFLDLQLAAYLMIWLTKKKTSFWPSSGCLRCFDGLPGLHEHEIIPLETAMMGQDKKVVVGESI